LLQSKEAVHGLFEEVAPTFETREGGYTRIIKIGNRRGDGAPMSILQLVGFEKSAAKTKAKAPKKDKKKAAKEEDVAVAEVAEETAVEEKAVETPVEDKKEEIIEEPKVEEVSEEVAAPETEVAEDGTEEQTKDEEETKEKDEPKA
jgi:large subunit ribosomal protein L17